MEGKELIDKILKGGWKELEESAGELTDQQKLSGIERYERASVVARPFMSPEGKACLAALRASTVESSSWQVDQLGLINAIGYGVFREGQNALVRYIEKCISVAMQGPPTGG